MTSDHDLPCNFLEYLEWRLDQRGGTAAHVLGEWLTSYKPLRSDPRLIVSTMETHHTDVLTDTRA
jgi:hypothetical protein